MKPVRLLCYCFCYLFWTWPCTTFNSIPFILKLLTNRNIASIFSVSICEQETKDCARSGSFEHKLQHLLFSTLMFAGFHNQPPLLTMRTPLFSRAVPGSEIVGSAESRKHQNENKTGGRAAFLIPATAPLSLDCEQSLIFLCKVTVRETQTRELR